MTFFIVFLFQAGPPETSKIPLQDAVGVTVVLLTCSYRNKEFIRVGYYVNNEYEDPEMKENPPSAPHYDKVGILACSQLLSFVFNQHFSVIKKSNLTH